MIRLIRKTYLKTIRNSVGSKMFRSLYVSSNGTVFDATNNGELSCAYYVSSLLTIFQFIERVHGTVLATERDLEASGWYKIPTPRPGCVIVWEATRDGLGMDDNGNEHIGFYVGREKAISNSTSKRRIVMHHWTYEGTRTVKALYYHDRLTHDRA